MSSWYFCMKKRRSFEEHVIMVFLYEEKRGVWRTCRHGIPVWRKEGCLNKSSWYSCMKKRGAFEEEVIMVFLYEEKRGVWGRSHHGIPVWRKEGRLRKNKSSWYSCMKKRKVFEKQKALRYFRMKKRKALETEQLRHHGISIWRKESHFEEEQDITVSQNKERKGIWGRARHRGISIWRKERHLRKSKTSRYLNMKKWKVFEEEQDIAVFQYEERKGVWRSRHKNTTKTWLAFSVTFTWPTSKYKVGLPSSSKRTSSDVLTMYPLWGAAGNIAKRLFKTPDKL